MRFDVTVDTLLSLLNCTPPIVVRQLDIVDVVPSVVGVCELNAAVRDVDDRPSSVTAEEHKKYTTSDQTLEGSKKNSENSETMR